MATHIWVRIRKIFLFPLKQSCYFILDTLYQEFEAGCQCLMPIIPAIQEAEIRRTEGLWFKDSLDK
jgi:hypothetical protein